MLSEWLLYTVQCCPYIGPLKYFCAPTINLRHGIRFPSTIGHNVTHSALVLRHWVVGLYCQVLGKDCKDAVLEMSSIEIGNIRERWLFFFFLLNLLFQKWLRLLLGSWPGKLLLLGLAVCGQQPISLSCQMIFNHLGWDHSSSSVGWAGP